MEGIRSRRHTGSIWATLSGSRWATVDTVATGTIVASGTVLHHGRCTATAEGRLGAADTGALLAHGPSTLLVPS